MMANIDMNGPLGEALRAVGVEQPSMLHSGINIQAEIKLRFCIGEMSMQEMGKTKRYVLCMEREMRSALAS